MSLLSASHFPKFSHQPLACISSRHFSFGVALQSNGRAHSTSSVAMTARSFQKRIQSDLAPLGSCSPPHSLQCGRDGRQKAVWSRGAFASDDISGAFIGCASDSRPCMPPRIWPAPRSSCASLQREPTRAGRYWCSSRLCVPPRIRGEHWRDRSRLGFSDERCRSWIGA